MVEDVWSFPSFRQLYDLILMSSNGEGKSSIGFLCQTFRNAKAEDLNPK
jgi:hypothetical protein